MAERGKKLSGALRRDPEYRNLPGKPDANRGNVNPTKGREGNMANKPTQRLSPGVYRSAGGGLVTQSGRPIQRQSQSEIPTQSPQQQMDPGYFNPELQQITNRVQNILANQQPQSGYMPNTQGTTPPGWNGVSFNPGASMPQFDPNNPNSYQPYPSQIQNGLGQAMTMPQMPQASANNGGRYRLSPGVYGTQQQAMNQYNQQMQQFNASLPAQLMKKY